MSLDLYVRQLLAQGPLIHMSASLIPVIAYLVLICPLITQRCPLSCEVCPLTWPKCTPAIHKSLPARLMVMTTYLIPICPPNVYSRQNKPVPLWILPALTTNMHALLTVKHALLMTMHALLLKYVSTRSPDGDTSRFFNLRRNGFRWLRAWWQSPLNHRKL